jgi:hypothetical protein
MSCRGVRSRFSEHRDQALRASEARDVCAHLEACFECAVSTPTRPARGAAAGSDGRSRPRLDHWTWRASARPLLSRCPLAARGPDASQPGAGRAPQRGALAPDRVRAGVERAHPGRPLQPGRASPPSGSAIPFAMPK